MTGWLPVRREAASNAVLGAPLAQTLAAIGKDTEIEAHGAASWLWDGVVTLLRSWWVG